MQHTAATARVVLVNSAGNVLLVRRSQTDEFHGGAWEIPGGRVEAGEELQAAAVREAQEEVGITPHDLRLLFATSAMRDGVSKTWLFYGAAVADDVTVTLSHEHDQYRWVAPRELQVLTDYEILRRFYDYAVSNGIL